MPVPSVNCPHTLLVSLSRALGLVHDAFIRSLLGYLVTLSRMPSVPFKWILTEVGLGAPFVLPSAL